MAGGLLAAGSTAAWRGGRLSGRAWLGATGAGAFLSYMPLGTVLYDRLLAAAGERATSTLLVVAGDAAQMWAQAVLLLCLQARRSAAAAAQKEGDDAEGKSGSVVLRFFESTALASGVCVTVFMACAGVAFEISVARAVHRSKVTAVAAPAPVQATLGPEHASEQAPRDRGDGGVPTAASRKTCGAGCDGAGPADAAIAAGAGEARWAPSDGRPGGHAVAGGGGGHGAGTWRADRRRQGQRPRGDQAEVGAGPPMTWACPAAASSAGGGARVAGSGDCDTASGAAANAAAAAASVELGGSRA